MKVIIDMVVAEMGEDYMAVPIGEKADAFNGVIRFNETGKMIWQGIAGGLDEDQITDKIVKEYEGVSREQAERSVKKIVGILQEAGIIEI